MNNTFDLKAQMSITYEFFDDEEKDQESRAQIRHTKKCIDFFCSLTGNSVLEREYCRRELSFAYDRHYEWCFEISGEFPTLRSYMGAVQILQGLAECISGLYYPVSFQNVSDQMDQG